MENKECILSSLGSLYYNLQFILGYWKVSDILCSSPENSKLITVTELNAAFTHIWF